MTCHHPASKSGTAHDHKYTASSHLIVGSNVLTPYQTSCTLSELDMVANQTLIVACEDLSTIINVTADYEQLKEAILVRYGIREETFRLRFRSMKKETYRELGKKLQDTVKKWLPEYESKDEVMELTN